MLGGLGGTVLGGLGGTVLGGLERNYLETAIMRLECLVLQKLTVDEVEGSSRDGAYIIGMALQGARWDMQTMLLDRSKPKEMFCRMPVINVKGLLLEKADISQGIYVCPTYKTEQRGPTYVFCAQLKTKAEQGKWVLAGVAMIMDVGN